MRTTARNREEIILSRSPRLREALINKKYELREQLDQGTETGVVRGNIERPIFIRFKIVETLLNKGSVSYDSMMMRPVYHSHEGELVEALEEVRSFVEKYDDGDDHLKPAS